MITLAQPSIDLNVLRTQVGWLSDQETMRYSEQRHRTHTIQTQIEYIKSFLNHPDNVLREIRVNGDMVGTISAYVDRFNLVADVGLLIPRYHWGKGYGYTAWAALCDTLFDNVGLRRIEGGCMAANTAMIEIFRKYGMHEEGRRQNHFIVDGAYSDLVLYGRFR